MTDRKLKQTQMIYAGIKPMTLELYIVIWKDLIDSKKKRIQNITYRYNTVPFM